MRALRGLGFILLSLSWALGSIGQAVPAPPTLYNVPRLGNSLAKAGGPAHGQICATRAAFPFTGTIALASQSYRFNVIWTCNFTSCRLLFNNFYSSGTGDVPTGGTLTVNGNVQYPVGVWTPLTFNGRTVGTMDSGGSILSDPITINGLRGQRAYEEIYVTSTNSAIPNAWAGQSALGDGTATSSGTDATSNHLFTASGTSMYAASAIITEDGRGPPESLHGSGDSILRGAGDTLQPSYGYFERWAEWDRARPFAIFKGTRDAERALNILGNGGYLRRFMEGFASAVWCEYGTNDLFSDSLNLAQLQARLTQLWQSYTRRGLTVYVPTLLPRPQSSTDSWVTTTNQTLNALNPVRVAYNDWLRTNPIPGVICVDIASQIEANLAGALTVDGGYYYCGPGNNTAYTADGTHPNSLAANVLAQYLVTLGLTNRIFQPQLQSSLYTGLIAAYKCDEFSGTHYDCSGNNNDMAAGGGGPVWGAGPGPTPGGLIPAASIFTSSSSQYCEVANNATIQALGGTGKFSFAAWFNPSSVAADGTVVSKWNASGNREFMVKYTQSGGHMGVFLIASDGTTQTTLTAANGGSISTSTWYFIYVTYDGTTLTTACTPASAGTLSTASTATPSVQGIAASTAALDIGRRQDAGVYWPGSISNVLLYNRVLTATELASLYNAGYGLPIPFTAFIN